MLETTTEVIPYTTASEMAATFERSSARIRAAIIELGNACEDLAGVFGDRWRYRVEVSADGTRCDANAEAAESIVGEMKRNAWAALIERLGVRKLMSAKRQDEMNDQLGLGSRNHWRMSNADIPDITAETIFQVLGGFVASADEFMAEAISEEYDFWKPHGSQYKTNCEFALNRKVIRGWMVERCQYGRGRWETNYRNRPHLQAIDRIMHQLDGAGIPDGWRGELCDAIAAAPDDGYGSTEYFAFRACKNGNLHLEFRRQDLLDEFNRIAGRARLPQRDEFGRAR